MSTTRCWPGSATLAGPLHGGASQLAYGLLVEAERRGAERALDDTLRWQGVLPGFGHAVYKHGDARFGVLYELFESIARPEQADLVRSLVELAAGHSIPLPNVDLGPGRVGLVDGDAAGHGVHRLCCGPGGRLGRPLSRRARGAAVALSRPCRLRLPEPLTPVAGTGVTRGTGVIGGSAGRADRTRPAGSVGRIYARMA